jgi:hypothetical protein
MRIVAGLIVALGVMTPAAAQEGMALLKAYRSASNLFLGGKSNVTAYMTEQPGRLFDGLAGEWFEIGSFMPDPFLDGAVIGAYEEGLFTQHCNAVGTTIAIADAFTAEFSIPTPDGPLVTTYSSRGGSVFGVFTPVTGALRRLGLDNPDVQPTSYGPVLTNINGIATMHRPSPDLLVVQINYSMPRIYARCPS